MITVFMSANKLNLIQLCAYKANLESNLGICALERAEPLEKGDLGHQMFEHIYRQQLKGRTDREIYIEEAVEIARRKSVEELSLEFTPAEETIQAVRDYMKFRENDFWKPLAVESPFSKILYERPDVPCGRNFNVNAGGPHDKEWIATCDYCKATEGLRIIFEGKIDLVVQSILDGDVYPVDHKFIARDNRPSDLSNQLIGYCWAVKRNNMVLNKVGFQKSYGPAKRFTRYMVSYLDERIEEWVDNTIFWTRQWMFYKEHGYYPMNWTSCDKWGGCMFRHACKTDPGSARDWKIKTSFKERESYDIFKGAKAIRGNHEVGSEEIE